MSIVFNIFLSIGAFAVNVTVADEPVDGTACYEVLVDQSNAPSSKGYLIIAHPAVAYVTLNDCINNVSYKFPDRIQKAKTYRRMPHFKGAETCVAWQHSLDPGGYPKFCSQSDKEIPAPNLMTLSWDEYTQLNVSDCRRLKVDQYYAINGELFSFDHYWRQNKVYATLSIEFENNVPTGEFAYPKYPKHGGVENCGIKTHNKFIGSSTKQFLVKQKGLANIRSTVPLDKNYVVEIK